MSQKAADTWSGVPPSPPSFVGCPCSGGSGMPDAASYSTLERERSGDIAVLVAFGCGNPAGVAELQEGETVLVLSAGTGIDMMLSAERVGPTGLAIGLDDTEELIAEARDDATEAAVTNVLFLMGNGEAIPLSPASVDVVLGNYVTRLAHDKTKLFRELARVLRPGGRMTVIEMVAERPHDTTHPSSVGRPGPLASIEVQEVIEAAGLAAVAVAPSRVVARGLVTALIRATKPGGVASHL